MTWPQAYKYLNQTIESAYAGMAGRLTSVPALPDTSTPEGHAQLRLLHAQTDELCALFARDRVWKAASREVAWLVLERLEQARDLARFVSCPELPHRRQGVDFPDEMILRWLLLDYWQWAGCSRKLYRIDAPSDSA